MHETTSRFQSSSAGLEIRPNHPIYGPRLRQSGDVPSASRVRPHHMGQRTRWHVPTITRCPYLPSKHILYPKSIHHPCYKTRSVPSDKTLMVSHSQNKMSHFHQSKHTVSQTHLSFVIPNSQCSTSLKHIRCPIQKRVSQIVQTQQTSQRNISAIPTSTKRPKVILLVIIVSQN